MLAACHVGAPPTPTTKHVKHRARSSQHPELASHRHALSVMSHRPAWKDQDVKQRFHCSYAVVSGSLPESNCHHWIGVISSDGHGRFTADGRTWQAHRYALAEIAGLVLPRKPYVYHRCGDAACVNPDHLTFSQAPEKWPNGVVAPQVGDYSMTPADVERFMQKVGDDPMVTCRLWQGTPHKGSGYGMFTVAGKPEPAHRVAYAIAHGSVPEGLYVCHGPECEELHTGKVGRRCVNPDHLIADTSAANMADRNGGHFRRPLSQIPLTPSVRAAAEAFRKDIEDRPGK